MSIILQGNRIIIPRWREYRREAISFEHLPQLQKSIQTVQPEPNEFYLNKIKDWKMYPSVSTAIELVNASNGANAKEEAIAAARLLKNEQNLPKQLFNIITSVLNESAVEDKPNLLSVPFMSFYKYIGKRLNQIRKRLIEYQNNPLLWLELARLHSILGNNLKAERSLTIAHSLSHGLNRAITRAYSRFYYHVGDIDHAHAIIRKSPLILTDPWLMSSEISYSLKLNRFSRNLKKGTDLIETSNHSPSDISELASMVGTVELFNGSTKNAKKYVQKSLVSPNDNSLAQAEWISRQIDNIKFYPWLEKVDLAFEARAHEYWYDQKYPESLKEGYNWILDQPFSRRAIEFSSYIAAALCNDPQSGIDICHFGLRCNGDSFEIINNLVYAYALNNQPLEAEQWIVRMAELVKEERQKILLFANEGLILYRKKRPDEGRIKYKAAIDLAKKLNEVSLELIAQTNFLREEYLSRSVPTDVVMTALKSINRPHNHFQIKSEIQELLNLIGKNPTFYLQDVKEDSPKV